MKFRIRVGTGKDYFTMSRGSFQYKRKIQLEALPDGEKYLKKTVRDDGVEEYTFSNPGENWNRYEVSFDCDKDAHFYGCGETYSKFDLSGEKVRIWVAEHQNSRRITGKIIRQKLKGIHPEKTLPFNRYESYYAQPTFTVVSGNELFFVHVDTKRYAELDFRNPGKIVMNLEESPHFFIGRAENFPELSEKLTGLLGRQRPLPDWTHDGVILAVQRGPEVIDKKIEKARRHGAEVCGIWSQDWCGCRETDFGYQVMWNWEYDKKLYPDLPERIRKWKEEGIRFLGYINPFLAIEKDLYKEASAKGYCVRDKKGADYLVTITTFPAAMIDFTNPDAYAWYKNLIKENLIGIGMGGWMADFGEYLPTDCVLYDHSDPEEMHNHWPAIWARMNCEAIEECGKENECFFFTRAGFIGSVKDSYMMWTGDQHVDWSVDDGLPSVIPATLSLAMSGFGLTHSDVGGYTTMMEMTRSKELLLRWEEMNVFSPLWRSHEGNQPWRNAQFDDDETLLNQLKRTSRMHAALKPYLKICERELVEKGTPVMRPVFYHYNEAWAYEEKTEYLLGRDVLVAPVLKEGARKRNVTLPRDRWIDIWSGNRTSGGRIRCSAPIGQPPVFVRDNERGRAIMAALNGALAE